MPLISPSDLPTPSTSDDVRATYQQRLASLGTEETTLQRRHVLWGYLRLFIGIAALVALFRSHRLLLPAVVAFALAARMHQAVLRTLAATRRRLTALQHAIARLDDRWHGLQPRTTRVDFSTSLYADDLDLFGPNSLFELLCTARTSLGEGTLATWLLTSAPPEEILARQAAVQELRPRLPLREAVTGARGPLVAVLDADTLATWAEAPTPDIPPAMQWVAPLLVVLTAAAAWRSLALHTWLPLAAMLLVNACVIQWLRKRCNALFANLQDTHRKLATTADLFETLQRESVQSPALVALQQRLHGPHTTAASAMHRLSTLATWSEASGNYVIRLFDLFLLYSVQVALQVQRWKRINGSLLRPWLRSLGDFEALLSLAIYSYEHPTDPFPQFAQESPALRAHELAHPLLPTRHSVRNDVTLDAHTRLLLISGSNMSGKSTLLRAIGVNAVLAFAGAPVRAASLQLSPLTLAASIHVQDSLQAGKSRFYAEILRLRSVTEAARTHPPALFLLDELLSGTNSTDRLAGAEAIVTDLLRSNAIGLLTTHDLALTTIRGHENAGIRNAHFEDQITGDELLFDYKLREGVVERSNGIALMRLVGLDV